MMCSVLVIEVLSGEYLWKSESELAVTNQAIKLGGTVDLSVELIKELKCRNRIEECLMSGVREFIFPFLHSHPLLKRY